MLQFFSRSHITYPVSRMAYEQLVFCDIFHQKESGWRECAFCGKVRLLIIDKLTKISISIDFIIIICLCYIDENDSCSVFIVDASLRSFHSIFSILEEYIALAA